MIEAKHIGLLGAGNMGFSLVSGLINGGRVNAARLTAVDIRREPLELLAQLGLNTSTEFERAVRDQDVVIVALKPQTVPEVIGSLAELLRENQLVVSIMAGVTTNSLEESIGKAIPVVRSMPQITARFGVAATAVCLGRYAKPYAELAVELFEEVGMAVIVEEHLMDAVTGLSGSGPAYVYSFIEALAEGGARVGLAKEVALKLAIQTVLGAATMAIESGQAPAALREQVTSPGGTTLAGLDALTKAGLDEALISAVRAATNRSIELGS